MLYFKSSETIWKLLGKHKCLSTFPPDTETMISKLNAKFTFIWKEDFGPLSNSPVLFLLSPGKMLLTMFLVQKWLGRSFLEDVWAWRLLMHWLQLQFTSCEALPSVWIGFTWPYSQAPCCYFFLPVNFAFDMLWYSTPEQPPLSVMTLCDLPSLWRVSVIVFWTIAKSAVFPILRFQRTRYPECILYGWTFIETHYLHYM